MLKAIQGEIVFVALLSIVPAFIEDNRVRYLSALTVSILLLFIITILMDRLNREAETKYKEMDERRIKEFETVIHSVVRVLKEKSLITPVLIGQLKEVIDQTEAAAMEIGDKFMSIVGRARNQASVASEAFQKLSSDGDGSGEALLDVSKKALSGVIGSLQDAASVTRRTLNKIEFIKQFRIREGCRFTPSLCLPLSRRSRSSRRANKLGQAAG